MRKLGWILLLALLLGLLAGCGQEAESPEGYEIFFRSAGIESGLALRSELRTISDEQSPVDGLMALILAGPESEDLVATVPGDMLLRSWTLEKGLLTLDMSQGYAALSGIDLTLANYSIVLTMTQLPDVDAVTITVMGSPVTTQAMQADDLWSR